MSLQTNRVDALKARFPFSFFFGPMRGGINSERAWMFGCPRCLKTKSPRGRTVNALTWCAGGLEFKSWADQILHRIANGSPPL